MKTRCTTAILALCAASLPAQLQLPQDAWRDFLASNGAGWTANWNSATGTPSAVYGTGLEVAGHLASIAQARDHAEAVLARHSALLGRRDSQFVEVSASQVRHLFYFIYQQQYKGLQVIGARADVRINNSGIVAMFGASAVPIPGGFGVVPVHNDRVATAIAHGKVLGRAGRAVPQAPRLVIWANPQGDRPTKPVLAWEVSIDERPTLTVGRAYIDAVGNAEMLEFVNDIHYCHTCAKAHVSGRHGSHGRPAAHAERMHGALASIPVAPKPTPDATPVAPKAPLTGTVMAWVNIGHKATDLPTNIPLHNVKVTSSAGTAYTDSTGQFSIPYTGTTAVTVSARLEGRHSTVVTPQVGTPLTASAGITPGTPGTLQFGTNTMGEQGLSQTNTFHFVNDINEWVRGLIPTKVTEMNQLSTINPIVNLPSSCNAYFNIAQFSINFLSSNATCNMTAFEPVIYHEWGHGLDQVFGGINTTDGLSEGWADVVAILRSQYPLLGEEFYKTQVPNYVRTALNVKTYPTSGSTHTKGEVWMGWAWDLRTDMVKRYGPVLGQQFTEQIVVPTIVANAPRLQDQILEIFLLDDDDANLSNGTPNYLSLEAASIKRTIPFPKIDVGTLAVTPLNGTDQQLTPRIVRANLVTLISKFDKVELVYDIGAGPQRRFMVPSGTANEYIALLPGVLSPTDVTYYVEATHSTAKVLRAPEFGEFGYSVGQEELFFADDFETVQPGWSTGALLGAQNDFSRGRPVGRAGTSWNVAWSDPNGAFSGNNSWGNNLNGAYLPQYAAFLRAPKLDLTGKTNVRLRFMRWLQVQDNSYDQAKILLDGNQVWANPWGSHLVDRGWTKFDLRLPGADNNPAAEIEWQLIADGGLELAGWNIDDVSLYSFKVLPPPVFQFVLNPAQVDLGKPGTASLKGTANAPVLLLFSTSNGPLNVPGLPTLHVGSNFVPIAAALNGSGELKVNFTAPSAASASGQLTYCQGLELTSPTTVTASNPTVLMWGR